jgi:hypothetical protein
MTTDKLLPCMKCWCEKISFRDQYYEGCDQHFRAVGCDNCGLNIRMELTPDVFEGDIDILLRQQWNTRALPPSPEPEGDLSKAIAIAEDCMKDSYEDADKKVHNGVTLMSKRALRIIITHATRNAERVVVPWGPIDEWHEDMGFAFWTKFPINEPYYSGSPLDTRWPGYHTHFIPMNIIGENGLRIVSTAQKEGE